MGVCVGARVVWGAGSHLCCRYGAAEARVQAMIMAANNAKGCQPCGAQVALVEEKDKTRECMVNKGRPACFVGGCYSGRAIGMPGWQTHTICMHSSHSPTNKAFHLTSWCFPCVHSSRGLPGRLSVHACCSCALRLVCNGFQNRRSLQRHGWTERQWRPQKSHGTTRIESSLDRSPTCRLQPHGFATWQRD
jgi:hypothetical protein